MPPAARTPLRGRSELRLLAVIFHCGLHTCSGLSRWAASTSLLLPWLDGGHSIAFRWHQLSYSTTVFAKGWRYGSASYIRSLTVGRQPARRPNGRCIRATDCMSITPAIADEFRLASGEPEQFSGQALIVRTLAVKIDVLARARQRLG